MSRQHRLIALWSALSLALLASLFPAFGTTPADLFARLAAAPWTMYALVLVLTLANQLAGAEKWRIGARQFSGDTHRYSIRQSLETTALGALYGQVLPVQITTALVRGTVGSARAGGSRVAVSATAYEQFFDLVVLSASALAGVLAISGGLAAGAGAVLVGSAAIGAAFLAPRLLGAFHAVARLIRGFGTTHAPRWLHRTEAALAGAAGVPTGAAAAIGLLGVARVALMIARVAAVAAVIAPEADSWEVALGYPVVGVIGALPITPGGLGVMEWSMSGLLLHAGAVPANAAVAAISLRLVNLSALTVILVATGVLRLLAPARELPEA